MKVEEGCSRSQLCRWKSSTVAVTLMDVTNTWHRGGRELPRCVGEFVIMKLRKKARVGIKLKSTQLRGDDRGRGLDGIQRSLSARC